jgi:hypothetical protein
LGEQSNEADKASSIGFHGAEGLFSKTSWPCIFIHASYIEQKYMSEMVEARRNVGKVEQRHDLFSGLLEAADDGEKLNDEELIGKYPVWHHLISWKMYCNVRDPRKHVYLSFCWT